MSNVSCYLVLILFSLHDFTLTIVINEPCTSFASVPTSYRRYRLWQMVKCGLAGIRACSLGLGSTVRLELVLWRGLVLGLAHFTFCHTSRPQNPASPHTRILPTTELRLEFRTWPRQMYGTHFVAFGRVSWSVWRPSAPSPLSPVSHDTCESSRRRLRRTCWARKNQPRAGTRWSTTDATRCSCAEAEQDNTNQVTPQGVPINNICSVSSVCQRAEQYAASYIKTGNCQTSWNHWPPV